MILQEMLDAIIERYPHSLTPDNIIKKINTIQKELFRTIYKPVTATTYDLLAENPFYPIDYSPQNIIDVVVDGEEYPRKNIATSSSSNYYYVTEDNTIGIYPTPKEDKSNGLTVFRYIEPKVMTTSDLGIEPEFDSAWHMLIVYRVCKDLAEIALDANMTNIFTNQYNGLESEYNGSRFIEPFEIKEVY